MINKLIYLSLVLFIFMSCEVSPKPINYGSDGCHFCSMTIVDKQHAAQVVTQKGKVFKFDAVECMVNHLKDVDVATIELFLVNDYQAPGDLIDAKKATFLISKEIPSPMGEYLSGFQSKVEAENVEAENNGKLYSWNELLTKFKVH
ncbi:nitrous oxide reductase accessory protein NosL [uncultured Eudoraea sp.]|uniref:nitrous oxide reductase accessory protein NosL n=1 Tax=uncultured Eudoraea sp. TaxID=1035614 RepID=UPI00261E4837|nr:nitrous oxide reductase accessory protein NosL [uncultured Eudoraea sp.]